MGNTGRSGALAPPPGESDASEPVSAVAVEQMQQSLSNMTGLMVGFLKEISDLRTEVRYLNDKLDASGAAVAACAAGGGGGNC